MSDKTLTLEQVINAGLYALREVRREEDGLPHVDVQMFLPLGSGRSSTFAVATIYSGDDLGAIGPATADELEADGWHHLDGCGCEYCRG